MKKKFYKHTKNLGIASHEISHGIIGVDISLEYAKENGLIELVTPEKCQEYLNERTGLHR